MRKNNEQAPPAAMPEAKAPDEQQAIIDSFHDDAPALAEPLATEVSKPDADKIISAAKKWHKIKLYAYGEMTGFAFIENGAIDHRLTSLVMTEFDKLLHALKQKNVIPSYKIISLDDLRAAPDIHQKISGVFGWNIIIPYSAPAGKALTWLANNISHLAADLQTPFAPAIVASQLTAKFNAVQYDLPNLLFGAKHDIGYWQMYSRSEAFKFIQLLIDHRLQQHSELQSLYTFLAMNTHLDRVAPEHRPTRRIKYTGLQNIASFLLGSRYSQKQATDDLSLFFLQQCTIQIAYPGSTYTCIFIEFAKLCFNTSNTMPRYAEAIDYFVKLLGVLPQQERIAWLGVKDIHGSPASTSFSALYYIALTCSIDHFKRVVNFDLREQPHLLEDVLKATLLQNPRLLHFISQRIQADNISHALNHCFDDKHYPKAEQLPTIVHTHYRDIYPSIDDAEYEYFRGYWPETNACGINPDSSAINLTFFLLNLPIKQEPQTNDYFYWQFLFKLTQSPEHDDILGRFQMALCHHFSAEPGSLKTLVDSYINIALHAGSDLIYYYPEACLAFALPIVQHGKPKQAGAVIAKFIFHAVQHYKKGGILNLDAVGQLLDHMDAKQLQQTDIYCPMGDADLYPLDIIDPDIYFDLLVAIKNPATRLTLFAKLSQVVRPEAMVLDNITQLIDLLREDIAVVKCEDLHKDTINQLGKFFHPFDSELTAGETSGQRIEKLISSTEDGTVTVVGTTTDIEIDAASTTQSDFKQGYLVTALTNFKRRSFGWNSFYDAKESDAPSRRLPDTLFKHPSPTSTASGISDDRADEASPLPSVSKPPS
ncbi:MAG: hypothetical protein P1U40_09355 [Coxiellaceae bacterium]|nr:hypothetical protein [Coxiellaceae bacterium]